MKKEKEEITSLEEYITFKKTHLLYDWIMGKKSIKTIEQEYDLYRGCIYRLREGFSWLADNLSAIAESVGWENKINEDLNKIKMLSKRLIDGVEKCCLNLSQLHIPGLSQYYIRRLVGAGYGDVEKFKNASEKEVVSLLPERLIKRIQRKMDEERVIQELKKQKLLIEAENCESAILPSPLKTTSTTSAFHNLQPVSASSPSKTENSKPIFVTILEIDRHRPDRIIFEGKEVKLTPLSFSLLYLLAQNPKEVLIYDYLIGTIWKESEDTTYTQVTFHLSKIRRAVLKTICHNKRNRKKVKEIFKVIFRRGIMLNLAEDKLKVS